MRRDAARLVHKDRPALLALSLLFVVMLVLTWQRWTHPIVDHGREMNVPLRLLSGELLYTDIVYHYGPVAPYFNALLYYLFGINLSVLHASGMVCAALILLMIYWLARRFLSQWEAALSTALVLLVCALGGTLGNYIQPYAYAALYGWLFVLASLVCCVRFLDSRRPLWMCAAGVCCGIAVACKPELVLLGAGPAAVAWALASLAERRWLWKPLWLCAGPAVAIAAIVYGPLVMIVPWNLLVSDTYRAVRSPQLMFFIHLIDGTLAWPNTGFALMAGAGMFLATCGLAALLGMLLDSGVASLLRRSAAPVWACLVAGGGLWWFGERVPASMDVTPFRSAPLVLTAIIMAAGWRLWRRRAGHETALADDRVMLVIAVFSLLAIGRVILNVSLWTAYTSYTVPTAIVVFGWVFFRAAPALLLSSARAREYARVVAMVLVAVGLIRVGVQRVEAARYNDSEIRAPRGRLLTDAALARTYDEAIRFAQARTEPGEYLLSLPQGTAINFLADRRNPLRDEFIIPGFLTPDRELDAIDRVAAKDVRFILVANHLTPEFRDWAFGVHYNKPFMQWIDAHYHAVATFRARPGPELQFGDLDFFIRAYERNDQPVDGASARATVPATTR